MVASFLVLLVVAEGVSVVVLHQVGERRILDQATRALDRAAEDLRSQVADTSPATSTTVASTFEEFLRARPGADEQAFLTFVGGQPHAASAGAPTVLADLPVAGSWAGVTETTTGTSPTPAGDARWLAVPVVDGDRTLGVMVAVRFLDDEQDALTGTIATVSVVTLLVLVGACLLAWGAAGRALAPLHELAATAQSVTDGEDLHARIDMTGPDEVGTLARSFDEMLDRLEHAFESQRRFVDDAGHELRTPLTIARGHLELLDNDPDRRAEEVTLVLDELDRMDRLVGELRVLARSQRPDFLRVERLELTELLADLTRKADALVERPVLTEEPPPGTWVRADRHRLTEAVLNLVDNADHASGGDESIVLGAEVTPDGAWARIWVRDHGPGIDPEVVPHLLERGIRTTVHRPGGTGLGLPLASAIARAHEGALDVESPSGGGTRVVLRLPVREGPP